MKAFKWQIIRLEMLYNAIDELLLSSCLWNYTADNTNELGDHWNRVDRSIFSRSQQTSAWREDINSGKRALEGFCRPYAQRIAGTPTFMKFNRKKGIFELEFEPDRNLQAPTEVYIPKIQYPRGYQVTCIGAESISQEAESLLLIKNPKKDSISLMVRRKK